VDVGDMQELHFLILSHWEAGHFSTFRDRLW
jgi:hypothetical protein